MREDGGLGLLDGEVVGEAGELGLEGLEAEGGRVGWVDWWEGREDVLPVLGDGGGGVLREVMGEARQDAGGEGVRGDFVEGEVFVAGLADEELFGVGEGVGVWSVGR